VRSENHKPFKILTPGSSLRRRVASSLAIVRLILVPVIFLAVYFLLRMDRIVDRIVRVDAPTATLAGRASVEILETRRAERNYLLLHDAVYLQAHREALGRVNRTLGEIRDLESDEQPTIQRVLQDLGLYEQQFASAVSLMQNAGATPMQRVQEVVKAYERDLNDLLKGARRDKYAQLIEDLRSQIDSFDSEITRTIEAGDPTLSRVTSDLQSSSQDMLNILSTLETRSWAHVESDREEARQLVLRAEWVLSIVSAVTLILSVWISFVLPRQVVQPLVNLRKAVDHAVAGNYQIELDVRGEAEVVDLAESVRKLIAQARQTV
jgi:CHASE3 domain sensor protein